MRGDVPTPPLTCTYAYPTVHFRRRAAREAVLARRPALDRLRHDPGDRLAAGAALRPHGARAGGGSPAMSAVGEMLVLTLPDGKTREVAPGTLGREVVASIGPGLLKAAIAIAIDGEVQDLMTPIRRGGAFVVI